MKRFGIVLAVTFMCVLVVPLLTACGKPWYLGRWMVLFQGVPTNVTSDYEGTTIEIDESAKEITLFMLGDTYTYEYELVDDNMLLVFYFDDTVLTVIDVNRHGETLAVYYTHSTEFGELQKVLSMEFELDSGNLYSLTKAFEIADSGNTLYELKSKGEVAIQHTTQGVRATPVNGRYTVSGKKICVYDDEDTLVFVGTFINDKSRQKQHRIEVDLTNAENADFARIAQDRGANSDGDTVFIRKLLR